MQIQPIDYSYVAQVGAGLGRAVADIPVQRQAEQDRAMALEDRATKRALLADQLKNLKVSREDVATAYTERVRAAAEEYDAVAGDGKGLIKARLYYAPMSGSELDNPKDAVIRLAEATDKWKKFMDETRTTVAGKSAQSVVAGRQTPVTGFTEDVGPVVNQELPAATQEQALSRYAEEMSLGRASEQGTKQLLDQPSISALPKAPEPPKPMTEYEKLSLKLKEDENTIARIKAQKGEGDDADKFTLELWKRADTLTGKSDAVKSKIADFRKIRATLNSRKKLSEDQMTLLAAEGVDPTDVNALDDAIAKYSGSLTKAEELVKGAETAVDEMTKSRNVRRAVEAGRKVSTEAEQGKAAVRQSSLDAAYSWAKTNATPTLYPTADAFVAAIPEGFRGAVKAEVDDARAQGASDMQILAALKYQIQKAQ